MAYNFQLQECENILSFTIDEPALDFKFGEVNTVYVNRPYYTGSYEITPKVDEQVIETREKQMRDNLTVLAIPYFEVANLKGNTVIIGGV